MTQGHTDIVLILPLLFLIIVILIVNPSLKEKRQGLKSERYFVGAPPTGGSSMTQGHTDIVFTLPLLFLITVIFMARSFVRVAHLMSCVSG